MAAPPAVEQVRRRLQELVRRPALPAGTAAFESVALDASPPQGPAEVQAPELVWERWVVHSEPGPRGRVPVLLARRRGQTGRRAAVLVLHGTLVSKEAMAEHLARYARQGYVAASFDSRYRGERGSVEAYHESLVRAWRENSAGPEAGAPGPGDEHPFMYDSAWDLGRVIDLLAARGDVDAARIGATGVSLGGMHVWFGAAADTRVAAAAPAIGVQGYRYAIEHGCWHARVDTIRPVFEAAAADLNGPGGTITTEVVEKVWRRICPGLLDELDAPSSLRCVAPRPLLVINGEDDPRCPAEGVRLSFGAAEAEYRRRGVADGILQLHMAKGVAHEVTPKMWQVIDEFLARHLHPERAGPVIASKL